MFIADTNYVDYDTAWISALLAAALFSEVNYKFGSSNFDDILIFVVEILIELLHQQIRIYPVMYFVDKFGKKVSTTLLRKIVVSTKHGQNIRDLDELAFKMCHSRATQASVYNKVQPSVQ